MNLIAEQDYRHDYEPHCLADADCCDAKGVEHDFGSMEHAPFTGNPHRKCVNCRCISLDLDD